MKVTRTTWLLFYPIAIIFTILEGSSDALSELLTLLAKETGRDLSLSSFQRPQHPNHGPLTEQEIMDQPFYTVVHEDSHEDHKDQQALKNYRTLMSDMLMSLRIEKPVEFHNRTIGEHLRSMEWTDQEVGRAVQDALVYGQHNSLCLAHGRKPIIPVSQNLKSHRLALPENIINFSPINIPSFIHLSV